MRWTTLLALCLVGALVNSVTGQTYTLPTTVTVLRGRRQIQPRNLTDLHVVGLIGSAATFYVGDALQHAAELAQEDINNRTDVLPGYRLLLETVDPQCDLAAGVDMLYRKLYAENTTKIMVLGATCSDVTEATAAASRIYNLVQISPYSVSPRLSDKTKFPWFFPLSSENGKFDVWILLFKKFNWTTVSMVQGVEGYFSSIVEDVTEKLRKNNIKLNGTYPFERNSNYVIEQLQAYQLKFYGPKIVWIFPGFYDDNWYAYKDDVNCTTEELLQVIDGYLTMSTVMLASEDSADMVGATRREFQERLEVKTRESLQSNDQSLSNLQWGTSKAPLAYDSMWAIALALNATLTDYLNNGSDLDVLKTFSYDSQNPMGERIFRHMKDTQFRGLSGNISFTATGDRLTRIAVKQFRVSPEGKGDLHVVGLYTVTEIKWIPNAFQWNGGRIPSSSRRTEYVLTPVLRPLYVAGCLLAGVGMLLSLFFLVFNIRNRNVRLIKMSSPNINNMILVGCVLVYSSVIVHGEGARRLDSLCHVPLYLLVLGFSLLYGSLFAKTWRVYIITTASSRGAQPVSKNLRDSRLMPTVFVLAAVNLGLLVVWTAVDPLQMAPVDIENSETIREDDWLEIQQALVCRSFYQTHFTLGMVAMQTLQILFGAFLAFQTRKVRIHELKDSRRVGWCIYIYVFVLVYLSVILSLGTKLSPNAVFVFESAIVIGGTTLTQCLLFVPKLLEHHHDVRMVNSYEGTCQTQVHNSHT